MTTSELRSFPPIEDTIDFIKQVDWNDVKVRTFNGVRNLLLVAIKVSEKSYDFHQYLYNKLELDTLTDEQKTTLEEEASQAFDESLKPNLDSLTIRK